MIYKLVIDYLNCQPLYIKDHPHNYFVTLQSEFSGSKLLPSDVPMEFFAFSDTFKIDTIYTINSTGGDNVAGLAVNNVHLGNIVFQQFRLIHKVYCALRLGALLKNDENFHGINPEVLYGDIVVFIGDGASNYCSQLGKAMRNASDDAKIIFLSKESIPFGAQHVKNEFIDYILPIKISKRAISKTYSDTEDEYIYFYCKDSQVREKVSNFTLTYTLKYTGIEIICNKDKECAKNKRAELEDYARDCMLAFAVAEADGLKAEVFKLSQKLEKIISSIESAQTHGAFIPWDDDIDVGLMRADIYRLASYLKDDNYFSVDVLYNTEWADRVYKFRFKGDYLPVYVDLFPFDYCRGDSAEIWHN